MNGDPKLLGKLVPKISSEIFPFGADILMGTFFLVPNSFIRLVMGPTSMEWFSIEVEGYVDNPV